MSPLPCHQPAATAAAAGRRRRRNSRCLSLFCLLLLLMLLAGVAWIQLVQSEQLVQLSQRQQTRRLYIPGRRGAIGDRHGVALNYAVPNYTLAIRPELVRDPRDTINVTLDKLGTVIAELGVYLGPGYYRSRPDRAALRVHLRQNTPMPIPLWSGLDAETMARWTMRRHEFPGTDLIPFWQRHYAYPRSATQLRGFTRPLDPRSPELRPFWSSIDIEQTGISGLEKLRDPQLRGRAGYEVLRTDVLAFRSDTIDARNAERGEDLRLTLDIACQNQAEQLFAEAGLQGALVIMDADNGEVIVMVSAPGLDLQAASPAREHPGGEFNRALQGTYPPGSTLKPFLACFALQAGMITPEERIECRGQFMATPRRSVACHARQGHGPVNLEQALALSCNVYFCTLASRLGQAGLNEFAPLFGFGRRLQTEFYASEAAGNAFSPEWARQHRRNFSGWHPLDSANAGIGQGEWLVTPLQMTRAFCTLLTGQVFRPKFLLNPDDQNLEESLDIAPDIQAHLRRGLAGCVTYGTGRALRIPGLQVLGKTGTAEAGTSVKPHSWSLAALPADQPRLIGVCILEHGGSGGRFSAPVLKEALQFCWEHYALPAAAENRPPAATATE